MRLNVFLAKSGVASRRKADQLIEKGLVKVNGKVIFEPWYQVDEGDKVACEKKPVALKEHIYLVLNKPKGVVTTVSDKFAKKTVIDILPKKFGKLFPVGRLDKETEGLLIMTNDGDLCFKVTHPKFEIEKEYLLIVSGIITNEDLKKAYRGVRCDGELLKIQRASIKADKDKRMVLSVVIKEGKNRHLRRLFEALGAEVVFLKRIRIANLRLSTIKSGKFKLMSYQDIARKLKILAPARRKRR